MSQPLSKLTTSRVGGPARELIVAETEDALIRAIEAADRTKTPLLILGGGSNVLISDDGFPGTAVQIATTGIDTLQRGEHYVLLRIAAGENWDDVVAYTVEQGFSGIEALSGIPGLAGATPVQNVGAYGAEIAETLVSIRAYDRKAGKVVELDKAELQFAYRDSIIKRTLADAGTDPYAASPRWIVLSVDLQLGTIGDAVPVRYAQLARALGVQMGDTASLTDVREHVLELRASKGMVLDADDHDTWSTGSFFTNPIVPAATATQLPEDAPKFAAGTAPDGTKLVKLSAAWLIDHAGFHKGFGLPDGPEIGRGPDGEGLAGGRASLSTKHTLSLTNRGEANAADLLRIATKVRDGVQETWDIELRPEPVLIGVTL